MAKIAILFLGVSFDLVGSGMDSEAGVSLPKPELDGSVSLESAIR